MSCKDGQISSGGKQFCVSTGCSAALSDANHDFKKAYPAATIDKLVKEALPSSCASAGGKSEDGFIKETMMARGMDAGNLKIPASTFPDAKNKVDTINAEKEQIFTADLLKDYEIKAYARPRSHLGGGDDEGDDGEDEKQGPKNIFQDIGQLDSTNPLVKEMQKSHVQSALRELGVVSDVFIICDVAYSGLKKDLTFTDRKDQQVFYWYQNTQTLYDPAGKTAWHTDKGYGFKDPNSRFRFAFQNVNPGMKQNTLYPVWDNKVANIQRPEYNPGFPPETMICTNKNMFMATEFLPTDPWKYEKHEAKLLMHSVPSDAKSKPKYTYADKKLASKTSKTFSKSAGASYLKEGIRLLKLVFQVQGASNQDLDNFSSPIQLLAKRCGDMPQALSCIEASEKPFCMIGDASLGKSSYGKNDVTCVDKKGQALMTTPNNMFVSFDRIAVAAALQFRAPMVLYDQKAGGILFVSKSLVNPIARLDQLRNTTILDTALAQLSEKQVQFDGVTSITYILKSYYEYTKNAIRPDTLQAFKSSTTNSVLNLFRSAYPFPDATGYGQWSANKINWTSISAGDSSNRFEALDESLRQYIGLYWGIGNFLQQESSCVEMGREIASFMIWQSTYSNVILTQLGMLNALMEQMKPGISPFDEFDQLEELSIVLRQKSSIVEFDVNTVLFQTIKDKILGNVELMSLLQERDSNDPNQLKRKDQANQFIDIVSKILDTILNMSTLLNTVASSWKLVKDLYTGSIAQIATATNSINPDIAGRANEEYYTAIRSIIPDKIAANIGKISPMKKYKNIKLKESRNKGDDLAPEQKMYGEGFFDMRNKMFQTETVIRPLWSIVSTIKNESVIEGFRSGLINILQTMLTVASGTTPSSSEIQPQATSFLARVKSALSNKQALNAAGGLAVLTEAGMRDIAGMMYGKEISQSGGSLESADMDVADAVDYFKNITRENAILNSGLRGQDLANQMVKSAQAAITMDSFIRLLGSVVGYNCLNYRVAQSLVPELAIKPVTLIAGSRRFEQQAIVDLLKPYFADSFSNDVSELQDSMDWISTSSLDIMKQSVPYDTEHIFFALDSQIDNTKTRISAQSNMNIFQSIAHVTEVLLELKEGNPYPFNENKRDEINEQFDISVKNNTFTIRDPVVASVFSNTMQFLSNTSIQKLSNDIQATMEWRPVVSTDATKRKNDAREIVTDPRVVHSEPNRRIVTAKRRKVAPASAGGGRKTRKKRVHFK